MAEITMQIPLRGVVTEARHVSTLGRWIEDENKADTETHGTWELNDNAILQRYQPEA